MRISDITLGYFSVLWFAYDVAGHIIMANSDGGEVPAFVQEDEERAEQIAQILCGTKAVDRGRKPPLDYEELTRKGYFCFQCDDYDGLLYHLRAKPENPLHFDDLSEEVQRLLQKQRLPFDVEKCTSFNIRE